jgi:hypothetical protein
MDPKLVSEVLQKAVMCRLAVPVIVDGRSFGSVLQGRILTSSACETPRLRDPSPSLLSGTRRTLPSLISLAFELPAKKH